MAKQVFKDILLKYNEAVANVSDLSNALKSLIGKDDWEDTVISSKSISVQTLYNKLKEQRDVREELESKMYEDETTPSQDSQKQPVEDGNTQKVDSQKQPAEGENTQKVDSQDQETPTA